MGVSESFELALTYVGFHLGNIVGKCRKHCCVVWSGDASREHSPLRTLRFSIGSWKNWLVQLQESLNLLTEGAVVVVSLGASIHPVLLACCTFQDPSNPRQSCVAHKKHHETIWHYSIYAKIGVLSNCKWPAFQCKQFLRQGITTPLQRLLCDLDSSSVPPSSFQGMSRTRHISGTCNLKRNQLEQKRHIQVQHLQTKLPEDPSDLQPFDREVHVHIRTVPACDKMSGKSSWLQATGAIQNYDKNQKTRENHPKRIKATWSCARVERHGTKYKCNII